MLLLATPAEDLARARRMIDVELRYEAAIELCERAVEGPDLSRKERAEAYRLLGIAYAAKGKPDSAEAAFAALLEIEPDFVLDPLLSPKIRTLFEHAQASVANRPRFQDVSAAPSERRVTISARLVDPAERVQVVLLFSRFGDAAFESSPMSRSGDRSEAVLALPLLERIEVDYYLEAHSAAGDVVARAGSSQTPSSIVLERRIAELAPPPPPPVPELAAPTPWYGEWWVWAIAVGVIGAGVATAVVIDRSGGDDPMGTLDPIHLD